MNVFNVAAGTDQKSAGGMKWRSFLACGLAACCVGSGAQAETWQTTQGVRQEGELAGVYGTMALIKHKNASMLVPVADLDDASLSRVAAFLARPAPQSLAWKDSTSKVGKALRNRLQVYRDGKLVNFEPGERPEPEFYLVYFGAYWCGPCRRFSPRFVEAYKRLKEISPDRFEAVFVSSDEDGREMLKYVREVNMPWPLLKFSSVGRAQPIERWAGRGIPCLVALTREGDLLFHSYKGEEYLGPDDVLEKFEALLRVVASTERRRDPDLHRLAVLQHILASAGGSRAAKPYLIRLDLKRYQALEITELKVTLDIDEKGIVQDTKIEPKLPAVIEYELLNTAGTWLFLPAVEEGKPRAMRVALPLKIGDAAKL